MASRKKPSSPQALSADDRTALREVLGHLNFASGKRKPAFLQQLNRLWNLAPASGKATGLAALLREELQQLAGTSGAFAECTQAQAVIGLALEDTLAAYRAHHADLLSHLKDDDFEQPLLLGCMSDAVLAQGGPWDERKRIVEGAVRQLNDFVGYRPVAV